MVIDTPIPLEPQPVINGFEVFISLLVVREAGSKMCCDEADRGIGVVQPDRNSTLVTSHTCYSRLLDAALDVFDIPQNRRLNEYAERCADELSTPQDDVLFVADLLRSKIQRLLHGLFPELLAGRITVHDLLRAEFHNFLEADGDDIG